MQNVVRAATQKESDTGQYKDLTLLLFKGKWTMCTYHIHEKIVHTDRPDMTNPVNGLSLLQVETCWECFWQNAPNVTLKSTDDFLWLTGSSATAPYLDTLQPAHLSADFWSLLVRCFINHLLCLIMFWSTQVVWSFSKSVTLKEHCVSLCPWETSTRAVLYRTSFTEHLNPLPAQPGVFIQCRSQQMTSDLLGLHSSQGCTQTASCDLVSKSTRSVLLHPLFYKMKLAIINDLCHDTEDTQKKTSFSETIKSLRLTWSNGHS